MLTPERIRELASRKNVKATPTLNFLFSVGQNKNEDIAYANMERDARSYGWNAATCCAIRTGISEHFAK
jgi:hypothetical protein